MSDRMSYYRIIDDDQANTATSVTIATPARSHKLRNRLYVTLLVTLTLVLGAFYAPLLWEMQPIRAGTTNSAPARFHEAQTLQVDPTLLKNQEALADLYDQIAPSVVSIQVTARAQATINIPGFNIPQGEAPLQQGQGSGFIYDNEGHIVTNNHVVDNAEEVTVLFSNGFWADADVVATDPQADLAVIKVTPPSGMDWRPLPIAADTLRVGHTVIAMGNPFGLEGTMTIGIVSAIGRGMPVGQFGESRYTLPDIIQTDAAINPGNSGGPLINLAGEVVGVNFAIESAVRSNSGVGFTIPASIVQRVVPALIADGQYDYAFLGLSGRTIDAEVARAFDFPNTLTGVYVATVVDGGPSETAGIQGSTRQISVNGSQVGAGGDIVTAIDDMPVRRFEDLVGYLVTKAAPGQTVTLTVLRDNEEVQIDVVLGSRPNATTQLTQAESPSGPVSARQASRIAVEATAD
ncbi:MAG: trypsin-like peptidase domain-containing protein, partial [Caldilineaceae bacterium]|nr:trypsin-like peptidase domain-containing protein [Caldilineaceae bacterium]